LTGADYNGGGIGKEKDLSCHQGAIKLTHKTGIECSEMNGIGILLDNSSGQI